MRLKPTPCRKARCRNSFGKSPRGRPGLITHVGLHTFIDPRVAGGRQSEAAKEDLVELVTFQGREWIFYKPFHIDMALLRGTTSDEDGNITMEREAVFGEMLSMAQATRQRGGLVIAQVQRMAKRGTLPGKAVKIPGILVDVVVVEPDQMQTYRTSYDPAYAGETRIPLTAFREMPLNERKIIARRCALELLPGAVCNIGSGVSTGIPLVAAEEGILEDIVLTNEQGVIGGAPAEGGDTGAGRNYAALVDQCYQFDFYDGGGIDLAFLSAAEVDVSGNVNISRFGDKIIGVGGFVNISQNAKKVVFSGTLTAGKLAVDCGGGKAFRSCGKANTGNLSSRFRRLVTMETLPGNGGSRSCSSQSAPCFVWLMSASNWSRSRRACPCRRRCLR